MFCEYDSCLVIVIIASFFYTGSVVRNPIPLSVLPSHCDRMHTNENCGFGEEYRVSVCVFVCGGGWGWGERVCECVCLCVCEVSVCLLCTVDGLHVYCTMDVC